MNEGGYQVIDSGVNFLQERKSGRGKSKLTWSSGQGLVLMTLLVVYPTSDMHLLHYNKDHIKITIQRSPSKKYCAFFFNVYLYAYVRMHTRFFAS